MKTAWERWLPIVLCAAVVCDAARADRSRVGDDSLVADPGECELEIARERQTARNEPAAQHQMLQLDCGVGWQSELSISVALQRAGGASERGLAIEGR